MIAAIPATPGCAKVYPKLVRNTEFWLAERGGRKDGLFFFAGKDAGWECCDDSIRLDNGYRFSKTDSHRLWPPDLNSYMVTHYRALAYMAGRLALPGERKKWIKEADALASRINERLWDDHLGFYVDRDRVTGKNGPALSPAGFLPLFVHIAPPDRAARIAKLAADPAKFFPAMPSVAYDTRGYTANGYWRGPTWLNWSYFALKGLKDYGCNDLASSMRELSLSGSQKHLHSGVLRFQKRCRSWCTRLWLVCDFHVGVHPRLEQRQPHLVLPVRAK